MAVQNLSTGNGEESEKKRSGGRVVSYPMGIQLNCGDRLRARIGRVAESRRHDGGEMVGGSKFSVVCDL